MAGQRVFPDVEVALEEYLGDFGMVVTLVPLEHKQLLADGTPAILRVNRSGGGESANKASDEPRVSVQIFTLRSADDPRRAYRVAADVRAHILNLPAITAAGRLDSASTESGPTTIPWADPEVHVVQMVFRLSTRP